MSDATKMADVLDEIDAYLYETGAMSLLAELREARRGDVPSGVMCQKCGNTTHFVKYPFQTVNSERET